MIYTSIPISKITLYKMQCYVLIISIRLMHLFLSYPHPPPKPHLVTGFKAVTPKSVITLYDREQRDWIQIAGLAECKVHMKMKSKKLPIVRLKKKNVGPCNGRDFFFGKFIYLENIIPYTVWHSHIIQILDACKEILHEVCWVLISGNILLFAFVYTGSDWGNKKKNFTYSIRSFLIYRNSDESNIYFALEILHVSIKS